MEIGIYHALHLSLSEQTNVHDKKFLNTSWPMPLDIGSFVTLSEFG